MTEVESLDQSIDLLSSWIATAGKALKGFHNSVEGVFWRDSDKETGKHPTSTARSFVALCEYLRFLLEETDSGSTECAEVKRILRSVGETYTRELVGIRDAGSNGINMFTDGHLLIASRVLSCLGSELGVQDSLDRMHKDAETIGQDNTRKLQGWLGGKVRPEDQVHDFVTLYVLRGLDCHYVESPRTLNAATSALGPRVHDSVLRFLAYAHAKISARFDASELCFSVALLNRLSSPDVEQLTPSAMESIGNAQLADGSWPTSQYVSYKGRGLLHVASYEVALALADLVLRDLSTGRIGLFERLLPILERTLDLVRAQYNTVGSFSGWVNDHARRNDLVESWATAAVLLFLIHCRDCLTTARQTFVLRKYSVTQSPLASPVQWPDLVPLLRKYQQCRPFDEEFVLDPTTNLELTASVNARVIGPIESVWIRRPEVASLLIYGPPGTGKTSLASAIARSLGWPLLAITPSDFLRKGGLDALEATAVEIFDDLQRLHRVVVLFDDCEDFFAPRPKQSQLESRTIGAFITAGMLPKLQNLRTRGWGIFVLATNSDPSALDPAVLRLGRFDNAIHLNHPTLEAQIRYVERNGGAPAVVSAIKRYETTKKPPVAKTPPDTQISVSFAHLRNLLTEARRRGLTEEGKIESLLKELAESKGPPPL